ncbi:MAG: hypothetical protein LC789_08100 [Actinobacteria bacterium]|nr:hypothetical protein [Actinomycetota bacterium]
MKFLCLAAVLAAVLSGCATSTGDVGGAGTTGSKTCKTVTFDSQTTADTSGNVTSSDSTSERPCVEPRK